MALSPDLEMPRGLEPGQTIETDEGSWTMYRTGILGLDKRAIFVSGEHSTSHHYEKVPQVIDINAYTSSIIEIELEGQKPKNEPQHQPERPPLLRRLNPSPAST